MNCQWRWKSIFLRVGGFGASKEDFSFITVELEKAKREEIDNEQEGSKDRTLGYTRGDGGRMGSKCFELDKLSTAREIRFKPVHG